MHELDYYLSFPLFQVNWI